MAGRISLVKTVVFGDGGVGKTSLTTRFVVNHFVEEYDPTGCDDYRKQVVVDQRPFLLELLDTIGQEEYTALRDQWIRDGDAFLILYSLTSRPSFDAVRRFHEQILRVKGKTASSIPIHIIGNKSDLGPEHREVPAEEGRALSEALGAAGFLETSAKNGNNTDEAFYDLVRSWVRISEETKRQQDEKILAAERERQQEAKSGVRDRSLRARFSRFIAKLKP